MKDADIPLKSHCERYGREVGVPYKRRHMSKGNDIENVSGHGHVDKNLVFCSEKIPWPVAPG